MTHSPAQQHDFDVIVIGGGPAGMAAALAAREQSTRVALIERNAHLGGILRQCIHPGFGLTHFKEELTGPEYAQRFINRVNGTDIEVMLDSMVLSIDGRAGEGCTTVGHREPCSDKIPAAGHTVTVMSPDGMRVLACRAVVLAMGCRERTRSEIKIPGSRPAGVFTAGLAQRYINIENLRPGTRAVILGSGDIGLIMARRCALEGIEVEGVYELMPYANGLHRNVKNCLEDFGIPLHLSTTVTRVIGRERVEAVEVTQVDEQLAPIPGTERIVPCDTLLLSVGLIPENELSTDAGVALDPRTRGARVDQDLQTSVPGIFSSGNVLHVHDLADNVTDEATRAGHAAATYARTTVATGDDEPLDANSGLLDAPALSASEAPACNFSVSVDGLAGYVVPARISRVATTKLFFRVKRPVEQARLRIYAGEELLFEGKPRAFKPSIMESAALTAKMLERAQKLHANGPITLCIDPVEED